MGNGFLVDFGMMNKFGIAEQNIFEKTINSVFFFAMIKFVLSDRLSVLYVQRISYTIISL